MRTVLKIILPLVILAAIVVYFTRPPPPYFGEFVGTVKAEWLDPDRKMKLLEEFTFIDPNNMKWHAPSGSVIDGASIPSIAWSLIGGPFTGKYRKASVIHDVACKRRNRPWESVHEAFWYAMRASGVKEMKAQIMYAAVYHGGPRWEHTVSSTVPRSQVKSTRKSLKFNLKSSSDPRSMYKVRVKPKTRTPDEILRNQPEKSEVSITVIPQTNVLKKPDFQRLRQAIESGGMTLEEIRKFNP